jgi:D-amino peptidase
MKIYIHTDLEGISGIDAAGMEEKGNPGYRRAVERLMSDLNAAVDGAFSGGATHVTVLDSHGGGGNFDLSLLDKRADNDTRQNKQWWGKLDETYAGTFFIGAHAMAGTMNAFLDHTDDSLRWLNYFVNNRRMGELGMWAMVAGHFNVPMLMVAGDEAACVEARQFFDPVECAVVKRGVGRSHAVLVEPAEAANRTHEAARKALLLVGKAKVFKPHLPMEVKLELTRSDYCDALAENPRNERIDARTVRKFCSNYLDLAL